MIRTPSMIGSLLLAGAAGFLSASPAAAGTVVGSVAVAQSLGLQPGPDWDRVDGNDPLSASSSETNDEFLVTGHAIASTNILASNFLRAYSDGSGPGAGLFSPDGHSDGFAGHRDIAYIASGSPPAIRLNFEVDGILQATIPSRPAEGYSGFPQAVATVTVVTPYNQLDLSDGRDPILGHGGSATYTDANGVFQIIKTPFPGFSYAHEYIARVTDSYQTSGNRDFNSNVGEGWDSISWDPITGQLRGTMHIDATFDSDYGGYVWGLGLDVTTSGKGGSAVADFMNTVGLTSVTLPDGTPIAGVSFASGLGSGPTAVPEPSTLVTSSILLAMFGAVWSYKLSKQAATVA